MSEVLIVNGLTNRPYANMINIQEGEVTLINAEINVGDAIWLEPTHLHFHHDEQLEVKVFQGYAMKSKTITSPETLKGVVWDPSGHVSDAVINCAGTDQACRLIGAGGPEGGYVIQVENNLDLPPGIGGDDIRRMFYRARMLVPVGHHVHGHGKPSNQGLELVPAQFGDYHPDDTLELLLLFDGAPLPGVEVLATYHLYEGNDFTYRLTADQNGRLKFDFTERGHWMFQVGLGHDGAMHISTLVVPGVR